MAPVSIRQALIILHTLYEALRNFRGPNGPYAVYNPFHAARKRVRGPRTADPHARALTAEEWSLMQRALDEMPDDNPSQRYRKARARWVVALLYRLWLRRAEAWTHRMGDLHKTPKGWQIRVLGKGNKVRPLPVPTRLIDDLRIYRRAVGWTDYPTPGESHPLVGSAYRPDEPVQDQAIYGLLKAIGRRAASYASDEVTAARLRKMSPHWLRHTALSRFLDSGGDLRSAQYYAGHSSPNTTTGYDRKDFERVRKDLERDY